MIDLLLRAGTKAALATFLRNRGLTNADNNPVPGFEATWWGGTGKVMSAKPVMNGTTVVTPATYLAGYVLPVRATHVRATSTATGIVALY